MARRDRPTPIVEVSSDPADLQRIRAAAAQAGPPEAELVRNSSLTAPPPNVSAVAAAIDILGGHPAPPVSIRALQLRLRLDPLADLPADGISRIGTAMRAVLDSETDNAASSVLHHLIRRGHAAEAREAALLLLRVATTAPRRSLRNADVWFASRVAGPEALDSLEALAADADPGIAVEAAHALARLKGHEALPLLLRHLDDPKPRSRAADGIGLLFENTADAAMTRRLTDVAANDGDGRSSGALAQALVRISGPLARATALGLLSRLEGGHDRQRVLWSLEGITLADAVTGAIEAGLIDKAPDEEEWGHWEATEWLPRDDGVARLWSLLYHRHVLLVFSGEGSYPPRHDGLLKQAAAASRGLFAPESIVQAGSPEGVDHEQPAYRLSFISEGRAYEVACRQYGDHYDSEAVWAAVHQALADKGREERFLPFEIGGLDGRLFSGRPEAARAFCDRVFLTLERDPERDEAVVNRLKDRLAVGLP